MKENLLVLICSILSLTGCVSDKWMSPVSPRPVQLAANSTTDQKLPVVDITEGRNLNFNFQELERDLGELPEEVTELLKEQDKSQWAYVAGSKSPYSSVHRDPFIQTQFPGSRPVKFFYKGHGAILSVGKSGPQALLFVITETNKKSLYYDHITDIVMLMVTGEVKRKKFTKPAELLNLQDLEKMDFQRQATLPAEVRHLGFTPFLELHGIIIPLPKVSLDDLHNILLRKLPCDKAVSLPEFKQNVWAMWKFFISHPRIGYQDETAILAALGKENYRKAALRLLYLSQNLSKQEMMKAKRSIGLR
jgi:hypothetical protein